VLSCAYAPKEWSSTEEKGMTMKDLREKGELNDAELNAATGGSVVDTVVDVAKNVWNLLTSPPSGVKGEAKDQSHRSRIE